METDWLLTSDILGLDDEFFGPAPTGVDAQEIYIARQAILNTFSRVGATTEEIKAWVTRKRSDPTQPLNLQEVRRLRKLAVVEVETGRAFEDKELQPWVHWPVQDVFTRELMKHGKELRQVQVDLAKLVDAALQTGDAVLAEAPTGVGKSLAYIVPALRVLEAYPLDTKGVITTATRTLQKQLFHDVQELQSQLGSRVPVALVQGRAQYLCQLRVERLVGSVSLPPKLKGPLRSLLHGDEERLLVDYLPEEMLDWKDDINVDITCKGSTCSYSSRCLFWKERQVARNAQLLLTNHNLWLADLKNRDGKVSNLGFAIDDDSSEVVSDSGLLGHYAFVVVDEAHAVERAAVEVLSEGISTADWATVLDDIYSRWPDTGKRVHGGQADASKERVGDLIEAIARILKIFTAEVQAYLGALHTRVAWPALELDANSQDADGGFLETILRYGPDPWSRQLDYETTVARLKERINRFEENSRVCQLIYFLALDMDEMLNSLRTLVMQLDQRASRIYRLVTGLSDDLAKFRSAMDADSKNVLVVRKERVGVRVTLISAEVAKRLSSLLYRQGKQEPQGLKPSVPLVMTSATLADSQQRFSYIKRRLGILRAKEVVLPEVFDTLRRSLLYIPRDLPHPIKSKDAFVSAAVQQLVKLITLTNGKTLVLTSAASWARLITPELRNRLPDLRILYRRDMESVELMNAFEGDTDSVLVTYGDSYWQGIDVQGRACSSVILLPIPYDAPEQEHVIAKSVEVAVEGGNILSDYLQPEALIRIRQGLGRLLRSSTDYGILTILDSRMWWTGNEQFLAGLLKYRITDRFEEVKKHWDNRPE